VFGGGLIDCRLAAVVCVVGEGEGVVDVVVGVVVGCTYVNQLPLLL
jgi:hypothetical protein